MNIQVLATNPQMEGLEGIKFAKFLKRATGSKRMSAALLKTAATAAVVGGTAYYTNKKYGWWNKVKGRFLPQTKAASKTAAKQSAKKAAAKKAANKGANGWFNADLFKNLATTFLSPKTDIEVPQAQNIPAQANMKQGMNINPLLIGAAVIGGLMLMKK